MTKYKRRSVAALMLGICVGGSTTAAADGQRLPQQLRGWLNDYSPGSVKGGPYEMRAEWSLELHGSSGKASFSAAMNMETSDWGITKGIVDPDDPVTRGAHTHHLTVTNGVVSRDTSVCPTFAPSTSGGFVVTGNARITGNGSPAPFDASGNTAQICITGGSKVEFSNITFTLTGAATGHFGAQAIRGLVTCTWPSRERTNGLCDEGLFRFFADDWPRSDDDRGGHSH